MVRGSILVAGALALAGCGKAPEATTAESPSASTVPESASAAPAADTPPATFAMCTACHSVEPGKNGLGPSLHGVVGRKAGTLPGFAYSAAMKASGLAWDDATLDEYLTAPMKKVPGTKMSYAGQPDAAKRQEIIEYLKTLK